VQTAVQALGLSWIEGIMHPERRRIQAVTRSSGNWMPQNLRAG